MRHTGLESNDILPPDLGDDYRADQLLSRGYLASVWTASEAKTDRRCIAKVYNRTTLPPEMGIYLRHLQRIAEDLPLAAKGHIMLPRHTGEKDGFFYQIFDFVSSFTLDHLIRLELISSHLAFDVLGQLASSLAVLHENNVIHADVKPSNILVDRRGETAYVYLIDFGMVQAQPNDTVFIVGTLAYLHPSLRSLSSANRSDFSQIRLQGRVGPYVDLYSAGVVALEMLIGDSPKPAITTAEVIDTLLQRNSELRERVDVRTTAADLISRMLSVEPDDDLSAAEVASIAYALKARFSNVSLSRSIPEPLADRSVDPIVSKLEDVAESLARSTAALIEANGALRLAVSPEQENSTLADINLIFTNALERTRMSWRLSLFFTIVVFLIITVMVALAVALTVTTGEKQWGLIFGASTVPIILGVLIWKPFERLFAAAIQTQQIELIHVRTIAGFRGTTLVEERMRVCTEALDELRMLLQPRTKSTSKANRGSKKRQLPQQLRS